MAFVRGENLAQVIQRGGPLPVGRVVQLLEQSLSALQHAHTRGLIHRDLKPENVLLEQPGGHVQITDFGLALAVHGREGFGGASSHSGTPEFASPEQLLGERVDLRTDLYSISLVALYALTGRAPFTGGSVEAILAKQAMGNLPDVREVRDDVPDELLAVIAKGASRDPAERFPSAEAYLVALRDAMRRWRMSPKRFLRRILG
jgi:serine/threonine-protein kinase